MKSVVRLSASATSALPRWILFAIFIVYTVSGLFGRDPWKNEDAAGFGVMWTMATGHWQDWLLPNLVGKPITVDGPLMYWLGAGAIRAFASLGDADDAARIVTGLLFYAACACVWYGTYLLGRRAEVQPFKYAFGGEPAPRDYGRTLADGALLILLGCFGLAERGHETTPGIAQLACVALALYGAIRSIDKPVQGALWWGGALGCLTLSSEPLFALALTVCMLVATSFTKGFKVAPLLVIGLPLGLALSLSWPLAALLALPDTAPGFIREWATSGLAAYTGPIANALFYAAKNLPLFTWPAWPLAIWSWYKWKGLRCGAHIALPLSLVAPMMVLIVLQSHQSNQLFMLLLPPLSILAAFGLPTLKRDVINAIDWFALFAFTILGSFVWLVWVAGLTGFPAPIARNLARLVPGFQPEFSAYALIGALLATLCWFALMRWRLSRNPKVLWRSVVLTSAGTTVMWVLLMTLWLPMVNYSRTYRDVATQIARHLPADYDCVRPVRLGDAQIASFAYFGHMHFAFADEDCSVLLRQDQQDFSAPETISPFAWKLVWEGRRAADRDERFRLYVRIASPHSAPPAKAKRR